MSSDIFKYLSYYHSMIKTNIVVQEDGTLYVQQRLNCTFISDGKMVGYKLGNSKILKKGQSTLHKDLTFFK